MIDVLAAIHRFHGRTPLPRPGVDRSVRTVGYLLAGPDPVTYKCTISVLGSEPITGVPASPATYTGVTAVNVLLDPATGRPIHVLSPAGALPVADPEAPIYVPPAPAPTPVRTRTVRGKVVAPTWSGTWRSVRGAYDRWNSATDVYQAGSSGSGPLSGLATYGNRITALGAKSITRARLTLISSGHSTTPSGYWDAVIQGSTSGSRPGGAPSYTGPTATVTVPGYGHNGEAAATNLPADMRELLRTGGIRALGLTGPTYGGTQGTRNGRAWTLTLDYTVED